MMKEGYQIKSTGLVTSIVEVTPEMAREMLMKNDINRKVNKGVIGQFTNAIKSGEWCVNGEPIIFADDGTLMDGQHRLMAVINADRSIMAIVVRGIDKDKMITIDTGRARSAGDIISMEGFKYANSLSAIIKLIASYRKNPAMITKVLPLPYEMVEMLKTDERIVNAVSSIYCMSASVGISKSVGAFLYYLVYDNDKKDSFFSGLFSGLNLTETSPMYRLRERLLQRNLQPLGSTGYRISIALHFKAWNAYVEDIKIRSLRWSIDNEKFPTLLL